MASLGYLWKHRARPPFGSVASLRAWAKRLLALPELIARNWRGNRLRWRGAQIDDTAEIGLVTVGSNAERLSVGAEASLGRVEIVLHDEVSIGRRAVLNDGVVILTASHLVNDPEWTQFSKPVKIEEYAWVGMQALILPGVRIGRGAVVGAGAVVSKSVPDYAIAVGNPARILDKRRENKLIYNPCEHLAANSAWLNG